MSELGSCFPDQTTLNTVLGFHGGDHPGGEGLPERGRHEGRGRGSEPMALGRWLSMTIAKDRDIRDEQDKSAGVCHSFLIRGYPGSHCVDPG